MSQIKVTVWNEFRHEAKEGKPKKVYPEGIHHCIAHFLSHDPSFLPHTATLDEDQHGLTDEVLAQTDVLLWWGHMAHDEVDDAIVEKVVQRVWQGMGLIILHSGHYSKVFKRLMGTSCSLAWREEGEPAERIWACNPAHPIVKGLPRVIDLPHTEMYGEPFVVPEPQETVFISWFDSGEVFRSGLTYKRGAGNIFYFRPGHETFPVYYHPQIQQIIKNAIRWAYNEQTWQDVTEAPERDAFWKEK